MLKKTPISAFNVALKLATRVSTRSTVSLKIWGWLEMEFVMRDLHRNVRIEYMIFSDF